MVAMALTMFVMVILTQAFVTSLEAFSALKSLGGLQANLRTVARILQADLQADHFENSRRLSDPDMLTNPPRQGFVFIYQGSPPNLDPLLSKYVNEGLDITADPTMATMLPPPSPSPDLYSYRATDHVLGLTVRLPGNRPENVFSALVPNLEPTGSNLAQTTRGLFQNPTPISIPGQSSTFSYFNSQWAETYYFLVPTGTTGIPGFPTHSDTPLFALYRDQYLLAVNPSAANNIIPWSAPPPQPPPLFANISYHVNNVNNRIIFNAPGDVAGVPPIDVPPNRVLQMGPSSVPYMVKNQTCEQLPTPPYPPSGATLLQSNVVSFQVQILRQQGTVPDSEFQDATPPSSSPFFPNAYGLFDSANAANAGYNVLAIKITIRIFDPDTKQSRQITVIQDM